MSVTQRLSDRPCPDEMARLDEVAEQDRLLDEAAADRLAEFGPSVRSWDGRAFTWAPLPIRSTEQQR